MTMTSYLVRAYVVRFLALWAGLVIFLQMLDLLAQADQVLDGGGPPMASLLRYVLLRLPALIETTAPLAALLGGLTALVVLARNSEIIAMRAAGRSVLGLTGGLMAAGALGAVLLFLFSEFVVVSSNATLEDWRRADFRPDGVVDDGDGSWLMEDGTIIRVDHVMRDGSVLVGLRLFNRDGTGAVSEIVDARLAIFENDTWQMLEAKRISGNGQDPPVWNTDLKPEHFIQYAHSPDQLSVLSLDRWTSELALGSRPEYYYRTWLHQKFAGPAVLVLMPLLAAIAAFAHIRSGSAVLVVVMGISLGFLFVIVDNLLLAFGQFGALPPWLAAWLPVFLFGTIGLWIVVEKENA